VGVHLDFGLDVGYYVGQRTRDDMEDEWFISALSFLGLRLCPFASLASLLGPSTSTLPKRTDGLLLGRAPGVYDCHYLARSASSYRFEYSPLTWRLRRMRGVLSFPFSALSDAGSKFSMFGNFPFSYSSSISPSPSSLVLPFSAFLDVVLTFDVWDGMGRG
jgi:hypothetical protein